MKTALPIVTALLLISLAGNWYFWQSARDQERFRLEGNRLNKERIEQSLAMAKTAAARGDSLVVAFGKRRATDSVALRAVKIENKAKSQTTKKLKEPIQPLIDSIQALADYVKAVETEIAGKDEEVLEISLRYSAQIMDLRQALEERERQIMANVAAVNDLQGQLVESQGETRKANRKVRLWKVVSAALATGIVYLSLKE